MTSTLNEQIIDQNEQITGRGVSNDLFHDQKRPESGFDNINVVIRFEVMFDSLSGGPLIPYLIKSSLKFFNFSHQSSSNLTKTEKISRP